MTEHKTRVVVLGGGYAGTIAANRLRKRHDVDITLVNPRPDFVERIRLHQLLTGSDDAIVDYADILGEGIRLIVDTATRIDRTARHVALTAGAALDYDYLVYAVGSTSADSGIPGVREFAYPVAELEEARRLAGALAELPDSAPLCVVGAGPTGIETAAELAEAGRAVTLVCGSVLGPYFREPARKATAKRLRKLGTQIIDGDGATVVEVGPDAVVLADGRRIPSRATIWTAGFGVPDLAASSGLRTDAVGRLLTDETLTSLDDDRIVAAGDAAAPSGAPLRMSCQAATPLGAQAADTVLARIGGADPSPINQAFTGECVSLGRRGGVIQIARPDDSALPLYIGGRAAATVKEAVCKATVSFMRREARKPGSLFWFKSGRRDVTEPARTP
ncbi:MAG: FAD-dependent oxidoreductase [Mycobacterium sp.]